MFGWFNAEAARASRSKRSHDVPARDSCNTLTATSRPNLVSRARYTSPIPPAPIRPRISYGPSFSPTDRGIFRIQLKFSRSKRSGLWLVYAPLAFAREATWFQSQLATNTKAESALSGTGG